MTELLHRMPKRILDWTGSYMSLYDLKKKKIADRVYRLDDDIDLKITTDLGILRLHFDKGFEFDGRSGPSIIDWYVPNLGSIFERLAWLTHDGNGYATCLDFESTNRLLKIWLKDVADYSNFKASVIEKAVSLSKSWFGVPDENDKWHKNLGKFKITWEDLK